MRTVRRIAADILKVGESRVKIDPKIKEMTLLTRADVKNAINKGLIYKINKKGNASLNKGKRRTPGRKKGKKYALLSRKRRWILRVRSQRKLLRSLKPILDNKSYKRIYRMVKGGYFRSKSHLLLYLREKNYIK